MLNAKEVVFPSKPAVSPECKEFIKRCVAFEHPRPWPSPMQNLAGVGLVSVRYQQCRRRAGADCFAGSPYRPSAIGIHKPFPSPEHLPSLEHLPIPNPRCHACHAFLAPQPPPPLFPNRSRKCSCLAYRQDDRLDVVAAASHPYLSFKPKERRQSVSAVREPLATLVAG